jgi:hypothetical protein
MTSGCGSRPKAIQPPDIDPQQFAAGAMAKYDTDSNAILSKQEVAASPTISFSLQRMDTSGEGEVTAEELAAFAQKHWLEMKAGIIPLQCEIYFKGRPLNGATVTLEPEPFMQGSVHPASGLTRGSTARINLSDEDRPTPNANGVQNGLYLVRISKVVNGKETIPVEYNEATTLGVEVAARASYMPFAVRFDL